MTELADRSHPEHNDVASPKNQGIYLKGKSALLRHSRRNQHQRNSMRQIQDRHALHSRQMSKL